MKINIRYSIIIILTILVILPKLLNSVTYIGQMKEWMAKSYNSRPDQIKIDPFNHNVVWFTQPNNHGVARFDYSKSTLTEFTTDSKYRPDGLAIDKNGVLWFGEQSAGTVGSFDPISRKFSHYPVPYDDANPAIPTIDSKGNVWLSDHQNNKIIILNTQTLAFKVIDLPTSGSWIVDLKEDKKNRMWYSCYEANRIGVIDNGEITEYILPGKNLGPAFLAIDDKDNVWISLWKSNKIASFSPAKEEFRLYAINIKRPGPAAIAFDPKNDRIYLSTKYLNSILMLDIKRQDFFYSFPIPTEESGQKDGICVDKDGVVWFTHFNKNKIARLFVRTANAEAVAGLIPTKIKCLVSSPVKAAKKNYKAIVKKFPNKK